jgi:hypothetical protein
MTKSGQQVSQPARHGTAKQGRLTAFSWRMMGAPYAN